LKDVVDKIKTYARAVGSKVEDPDTHLSIKYEKEKFIERENLAGLTTTHFSLYSNFSLLTNHDVPLLALQKERNGGRDFIYQ
jgi:hypothetical protein